MIYSHLIQNAGQQETWDGWKNLWCLQTVPRAKHFIWLLLHNGIKTHEYLYRLNLGPQTFCSFCNLTYENAEHLFNLCPKAQVIRNMIINITSKNIYFLDGLTSGNRLSPSHTGNDIFTQSIIVTNVWLIWKEGCNFIFQNEALDCNVFFSNKADAHVRKYLYAFSSHYRKNLILKFTTHDSPFLYIAATWSRTKANAGAGFYTIDSNSRLLCAGYCRAPADSDIEAGAMALYSALNSMHDKSIQIKNIFIVSADLYKAIMNGNPQPIWRLDPLITSICNVLHDSVILSCMLFPDHGCGQHSA